MTPNLFAPSPLAPSSIQRSCTTRARRVAITTQTNPTSATTPITPVGAVTSYTSSRFPIYIKEAIFDILNFMTDVVKTT